MASASISGTSHPLMHAWAFWENASNTNMKDYNSGVRKIGDFDTVETFWDYWLSMYKPSDVFGDGTKKVLIDGKEIKALGIFKKDIAPAWEDRANADGMQIEAIKALSLEALDTHWQNLVFGIIGELLDGEDHICGARVVITKKGKTLFKFELWLRDKSEEKANKIKMKIGELLGESNDSLKSMFQLKSDDFLLERRGKKY